MRGFRLAPAASMLTGSIAAHESFSVYTPLYFWLWMTSNSAAISMLLARST